MNILLIKCDALIPTATMKKIHDDIVKQLETLVVLVPASLKPEIINVPDGVEVVVESSDGKEHDFLTKNLSSLKTRLIFERRMTL